MTRDELQSAAKDGQLALAIVSALAVDLLERGQLKPRTKTRIGDAIRDYKQEDFSPHWAIEWLREALKDEAPLEREQKRERPR